MPASTRSKRGLAGAVQPEDDDPAAAVDREVDAREHLERSVGLGETGRAEWGLARTGGERESAAWPPGPPRRTSSSPSVEARRPPDRGCGPSSSLGRLGTHAVGLRLQLDDFALGVAPLATPPPLVGGELLEIRLPSEAVHVELAAGGVEVEDLVDDRLEEVAVVADHHEPAVMGAEEAAQPGDRVRVEVVRRLVEDERRGAREQHTGQLDPCDAGHPRASRGAG